ncbi:unnamed protein product [Adineta steineri]|uniref:Uncharacterized protein n=1 Tax=Adineta steineri TaxID=433720 RepID=A0A813YPL1_9BILA|nr:unnamed protein product [Adineta steineri]CAF1398857.1 unnamed protein product [Adineta steineri]
MFITQFIRNKKTEDVITDEFSSDNILLMTFDLSQAGQGHLKAELVKPQASTIACRCHVHELNNQEYLIQYIPSEPGRYQLRLLFNNQLVQGKTIDTDVYSLLPPPIPPSTLSSFPLVHIQKISPNDIPRVGDDICLEIITEKSDIRGQISCNGVTVPCKLVQTKDTHIWNLKFRPYVVGTHKIYLLHNGIPIMSSPYLIQVKDSNDKHLLSGLTNTPCVIQIHTKSTSNSQIRAVVLLDTVQIPSTMTIINDNLIRINFTPKEPGFYLVNISNRDKPITGSPFSIRIERSDVVQVTGKCFHRLRLNDLGIFRIHCHGQRGLIKAKIYNLSVGNRSDIGQVIAFQLLEPYEQLLQFPSQIFFTSLTILLTARLRLTQERIRNLTLEEDNGYATVLFQLFEIPPQMPTNEQIINALRNLIDKQILNLFDPNRRMLHAICGSLVVGPKGESVNVKLFPQANGDYMGEFTPKKIGQHRIDITFGNVPIQGSPLFTEVYNPLQVRLGPMPKEIFTGVEHTFDIMMDNAGCAPLEISIISSSGLNVPFKINDATKVTKVHFTPIESGLHTLNAKFGSDIIPGTPLKMMVTNGRMVTAYGNGIHHALHETETTFMIDTKELLGDLKVYMEGPNSIIHPTMDRINNSLVKIIYKPVDVGFLNILVKWNGKDIINSPFKALVTNPERIRIVGGLQALFDAQNRMRVITNEEKKICFDTSQAGPGTLKADIQGADNGSIPLRIDQQGHVSTLNFTARREGEYDLTITHASIPLPNMPIRVVAISASSEPLKVGIYGRGSYEARVNEEVEFFIDASRAPHTSSSKLVVRLTGKQTDIDVRIRQIEKNRNIFICSYKPTVPGIYLLSIIWAEQQIRGSPFKVNVLPNTNNNHAAERVICSGDGLRIGILGKESKCSIDTRTTEPGELTVFCQGMNKKATCRLFDHRNGTFSLFIKPEESGKHVLTIKYNATNVPGSPFTVKVSGPLDANKVRVSGPGIEHGVLSTFQSHFICETKGAGAGQLTVKIRGPKGAFRVEMQREHLQDRTIVCRYNPTESGDYIISVKWSGEHVYGSPFHTHIFQTQEELEHCRQELNEYQLDKQQPANPKV